VRRIASFLIGWRSLAAMALASLAVAGGAFWLTGSDDTSAAANRYTAYVGNGGRGIAVSMFLPSNLTINEGDTINWTNPYAEPHTVSFNAGRPAPTDPMVQVGGRTPNFDGTDQISSGFMRRGASYEVTFTKAGAYQLICLIHAGQVVDVSVVSPGLHVPTQAQIEAQAKAQLDAAMPVGDRLLASIPPPTRTTRPDGTTAWTIPDAPAESIKGGSVAIMAFVPSRLPIGVGDTVTWLDTIAVPHTITFTAGGPPRAPTQVVRPPNGLYDGSSYVNSGQLGNAPGRAGTSFTLTFTKAGTYPFICILHVDQGMAGVVEVGDGGPRLTPPNTGEAGLQALKP
jgi:plastocyanin